MSFAPAAVVCRPRAYSKVVRLRFEPSTAVQLASALSSVGAVAWICRRGGLVVLRGTRRLRLVHDPVGQPATVKAIVSLVDARQQRDQGGQSLNLPAKRKARSVAAAGLLK